MKNCSNFTNDVVYSIIISFISISCIYGQIPVENDTIEDIEDFDIIDMESTLVEEKKDSISWVSDVFSAMRLGIQYGFTYKAEKPDKIMNNRFSFRLEYSKSFLEYLSVHIDTKMFTFLKNDHRIRDEEDIVALEGRTREAYLQTSFNKTSIKAGIQIVVWGESDYAIVTNEIGRLDYREPLSLNMDDLRIGQPMLTIDQYSSFGYWSAFFVPYSEFNEQPRKGTGYYYDPFDGKVEYLKEKQKGNFSEYGLRWRKTFGKSDISIMAASLIDNQYALRMVNPDLITKSKQRFFMTGVTFNRAINNLLVKGEVAIKSEKAYNDASFQVVKKNALDASLGVDYSPNSTFTLSIEAVNYHIMDWSDQIQGIPRNNYIALLALSKQLMKNNLSLSWASMYNGPYTNFFNVLSASYNWNDHITLNFDALIPIVDDARSGFYPYRDQKQVAFRVLYQL
ncbi:DUF1302 family protein [Aquimarina macrocephali]|uniref:DUF1302 family protein n=1 Tax=Aquimarina macrocephali TaxID=666563 RepID=UPI003F66A9AA